MAHLQEDMGMLEVLNVVSADSRMHCATEITSDPYRGELQLMGALSPAPRQLRMQAAQA